MDLIKIMFTSGIEDRDIPIKLVNEELRALAIELRNKKVADKAQAYRTVTKIISSTIPKVPLNVIGWFNEYLFRGGMRDNYWLVHYYVIRMIPYSQELGFLEEGKKSNVLTAGLFCFVGQCIMYWCQFGFWDTSKQHHTDLQIYGDKFLDVAFSFSLMYVYADYFLDGVHCNHLDKGKIMEKLMQLLYDPYAGDAPEGMKGLVSAYRYILNVTPEAKIYLERLFLVEVEGMKYQTKHDCTREQYFDIAERKGGMTGIAITAVLGLSTGKVISTDPTGMYGYQIGALLQLIDDMIDVYDDIEDGIHTIATHDLQTYGNMDDLFIYTAIQIHSINDAYWVFRYILMIALCYTLSQSKRFTKTLVQRHRQHIYVDWAFGNKAMDALDSWIKDLIKLKVSNPDDPTYYRRLMSDYGT